MNRRGQQIAIIFIFPFAPIAKEKICGSVSTPFQKWEKFRETE